jgi:hypothetical protein
MRALLFSGLMAEDQLIWQLPEPLAHRAAQHWSAGVATCPFEEGTTAYRVFMSGYLSSFMRYLMKDASHLMVHLRHEDGTPKYERLMLGEFCRVMPRKMRHLKWAVALYLEKIGAISIAQVGGEGSNKRGHPTYSMIFDESKPIPSPDEAFTDMCERMRVTLGEDFLGLEHDTEGRETAWFHLRKALEEDTSNLSLEEAAA